MAGETRLHGNSTLVVLRSDERLRRMSRSAISFSKLNQLPLPYDPGCCGDQLWRGALHITSWMLLGAMSDRSQGTRVPSEIAHLVEVLTTSESAPWGRSR